MEVASCWSCQRRGRLLRRPCLRREIDFPAIYATWCNVKEMAVFNMLIANAEQKFARTECRLQLRHIQRQHTAAGHEVRAVPCSARPSLRVGVIYAPRPISVGLLPRMM
jgi:hypothetical protein